MKITLITVCYNSEKTLQDTIDSVLSQTYTDYEYLIIDGKSNDRTISIIKDNESKFNGRLKWFSEKDKGLYDAMNKGIKMATGDIIGFINSDDILAHENVFENIIKNIGNYDGVYSNLLMLDESLINPYRLFKSKKMNKRISWHPPHPTLYLKKEIYEKYGNFKIIYKIAADLDFMLRIIYKNAKLKYVDDYFVYMRAGGTSTDGLKGYYKNFKESYIVLKNNNIRFPFFINSLRIFKTFFQRVSIYQKREIFKATHLSNRPKLIQINTVCNGSTGKVMSDIQREANRNGYQTISFYGRRKGYKDLQCEKFGGFFSFWFHVAINTLFDKQGYGSYFYTKKMVKRLKQENPDIIHLHNLHGYYLHLPTLFKYLKNEYTGRIYWTLHDCWAFTGHCPHFIIANCNRWKKGCYNCPNKKAYPISLLKDNSKNNYENKKKMFTQIPNLTILTPSDWLKQLVNISFLKEYKVVTISNSIDLEIFKPTIDKSILKKYNIPENKKIILGVANIWEERKGLIEFNRIAEKLNDDYIIVLVGLSKKQIKKLPQNIIGIKRTTNQNELVKLYSIADVFINPSREETFSLVTIEALACNTPIIVPKNTPMEAFLNNNNGISFSESINVDDIYLLVGKKKFNFDNIKQYDIKKFNDTIMNLYKE